MHFWNYNFPKKNADGEPCTNAFACDRTVHIAAPGRAPKGYGAYGHADLVGLLQQMVWDNGVNGTWDGKWVESGSFEEHVPVANAVTKLRLNRPRYWAAGGRCAR